MPSKFFGLIEVTPEAQAKVERALRLLDYRRKQEAAIKSSRKRA